jgi:hypothetical protein
MSLEQILMIVVGALSFLGLKHLFSGPSKVQQAIDPELISAYAELKRSGPALAEKKRKYEEALRNLKSDSSNN